MIFLTGLEDYGTNTTVRGCITDDPEPVTNFHLFILYAKFDCSLKFSISNS